MLVSRSSAVILAAIFAAAAACSSEDPATGDAPAPIETSPDGDAPPPEPPVDAGATPPPPPQHGLRADFFDDFSDLARLVNDDGTPFESVNKNLNFGKPTAYQSPRTFRFGARVTF